MRERLHQFDSYFIKRIVAWPKGLMVFMKFVSMTGFPFVTLGIGVVLVMSGISQSNADYLFAGMVVFATVSISSLLKLGLRRARPLTYIPKRWFIATSSFPSGHSTGAAVAYGTLALLIVERLGSPVDAIICALLTAWVILVGLSRVYLGAHYPSDVIAGWLLGILGVVVVVAGIQ